jgi:hypothetical protein
LVARILGSAVSHPSLMARYGKHSVLPRRSSPAGTGAGAAAGTVAANADLDVLIDMMAGAVIYRVLQPDPPDLAEMRRIWKRFIVKPACCLKRCGYPRDRPVVQRDWIQPAPAAGRARSLLRVGPLFVALERLANTRSKSLVPRVRC